MVESYDLLCVGEALVDWVAADPVPLKEAHTFRRFRGGSVANVAANAALLGLRVGLSAAVGRDALGDFLREELHRCGVDPQLIQEIPGVTTSMVLVSNPGTPLEFSPLHGAHRHLQADWLPWESAAGARAVHTSAFALAWDPARETIFKALAAAREGGALCSFEPNYHPHLWKDPADGRKWVRQALSRCDVVKPSLDDAESLWEEALPPETILARYHELGPRLVILTAGEAGAWVSDQGAVTFLPAPAVAAVDVVGAGDAFWAGLLSGLLDGLAPVAAAHRGIALSARKVAHPGPLAAPLDRRTLDA